MFIQIITHTPVWVWAVLGLLVWVGLRQTLPRSVSLRRILVIPLVMVGLSLAGTVTAFGASNHALLAWGIAATIAVTVVMTRNLPPGTQYNAWTEAFHIPGSWTPLALMMAIFVTKYAVGVALAMHPELAREALFSQCVGALYGGCSGVFVARAARLWRLASSKANGNGTASPYSA
jgi:hypothetical protein